MNSENICMSSKTIEIAEHENYLELTNRLSYYDDKNLNNVMLPYKGFEESALTCAKTLVNMPVQSKYKKINGNDDLGSHELRVLPNGDIEWGTESIGTHTEVWIAEDTVTTVSGEEKTLPCLYAKCRIWKRNPNIIAAVKRLYESDAGLNSSWEIATTAYEYKNGLKILTEYEFLGNCFLGSITTPAYKGTSTTISLSQMTESELLIAEALSLDMKNNQGLDKLNNQEKEDCILKKDEKNIVSSEEDVKEVPVDNKVSTENAEETNNVKETSDAEPKEDTQEISDATDNSEDETKTTSTQNKKKKGCVSEDTETSALTSYDLRQKINEACRKKYTDWCWVSFLFPEEHEVWCEYDGESELDMLKFTYSVENDVVIVSEPEKVLLTVSVKAINSTIAEYEKTISEKDELIINTSSEITSLKSENTELSQYKEKFTQLEQEKLEAELAEKKENLIASVVKSGQITREEIKDSEELSGYVNNLDKASLMSIVGERLIVSLDKKEEKKVETSEMKDVQIASNLNNDDDETIDKASIMRKFLKK